MPSWWSANEDIVRAAGGTDLAIIQRPNRKRLTIEISCRSQTRANQLRRGFGGRVIKLRRDWLKQFSRERTTKPLKIGKRLLISNLEEVSGSRKSLSQSKLQSLPYLNIPAGAAFGTGQHATTAMSLRLLERLTRKWKPGWSIIDLGTGSGIFALAAKRLGAGRIIGIDIDPVAISTAQGNARLNRITGVNFQIADVLKWQLPRKQVGVITANLFSELLIAILPRLRWARWLIFSGVMRQQERAVLKALKRNRMKVLETCRRGRWIALLATGNCRREIT